ncbi:MarR family transcriptional regulator [Nocardia cyriacigeorgica]|uniref:MarR family transcriptional regulator n=1 Tax=Nocardia cyriacigeorgica TaxID=135487 RepID=A0A6P1DAD2_9NOCA|nr:MarR family transcriptional regulator [Nocardia cyriacigeorgica]NEW42487.1 MarR family transcriptional regulator [Nocardia cyriacigeorgica]NEW46501.1 MarR family transcriptional regulator [Nocardia cyriacigeorgica]NEW53563.1 MarR family transcriptional regulator [Nocardia cyriacigeorgica]NEW56061.1 MarR family transcriptional regulator [Nocardia cyriacigeorgica]
MSKQESIGAIGQQLRLLQQSFDTFDETAAAHVGLNRTDMRCLDLVLGRGPSAAGELSAALRLSPAATTTVIDRLVRAGFATRAQDPDNRRRVLVTATDAARAVDAELFRPVAEAGARALTRYDEDALALILDFLQTAFDVHREQTRLLAERSSGD